MKSQTITSQRNIAKALQGAKVDDRFEITFAAVDNPVWVSQDGDNDPPRFSDAGWSDVPQAVLAAIVANRPVHATVTGAQDGDGDTEIKTTIGDYENWMNINAAYVRSLRVLPPVPKPTTHRVDGMTIDIVLHPEGHAVVGCQAITRKGLQQIHDLLGKHLAATTA